MKKEIIKITTELFLSLGFKSITMDDISKKMGISKKTLYEYFENKEMLVRASTSMKYNEVMNSIIEIKKSAKDPIMEVYLIKKELLQHLSNETTSPQYQLQKYYPEIYHELKEKEFKIFNKMFKESLKKGIKMSLFRKEIRIKFITRIYFNGLRGIRDINLFPLDKYKIDELITDFFEYHLRAISTKKGLSLLKNYKQKYS